MMSGTLMMYALAEVLILAILVFGIFPLVLSGANRVINRFWSPYARTLATVFLTGIVANLVAFILQKLTGTTHTWFASAAAVIATAVVGGAIFNGFVHRKDGAPLGYARAASACLVLGIVVMLVFTALSPWATKAAAKFKAAMAQVAPAASAPAAPASVPVSAASTLARATTAPATVASTFATAGSTPARAASVH